MTDVASILNHHSKYMIAAGVRIMKLADTDVSEFRDIGIERFTKLVNLLHDIWSEGLELTSAASDR